MFFLFWDNMMDNGMTMSGYEGGFLMYPKYE